MGWDRNFYLGLLFGTVCVISEIILNETLIDVEGNFSVWIIRFLVKIRGTNSLGHMFMGRFSWDNSVGKILWDKNILKKIMVWPT